LVWGLIEPLIAIVTSCMGSRCGQIKITLITNKGIKAYDSDAENIYF